MITVRLKCHDVACGRGGVSLFQGLSFELNSGQALILRGPNGIGKTTLLRSIVGLQSPLSGEIACDLDDTIYASHLDGVKPTLSVEENLVFWADIFGTDLDADIFEQVGLQGLEHRAANTLSAGQRRRLGLARIAVSGRNLLCLDEPTVSLDAESVARFTKFLEKRLAEGASVLVATHIDLGLNADTLDMSGYRAPQAASTFAGDAW